jgi:hypothetical protein
MRQIVRFCIGLLVLAVVIGCGPKRPKVGVVTGKITYKGDPVNGASLLLYPASGAKADPIVIPVSQEGDFRIADVPEGEYKIVVQGTAGAKEAPMKNIPKGKEEEVKKMLEKMNTPATIPFPDKYKKAETTTLKCSVTKEDRTQDLDL